MNQSAMTQPGSRWYGGISPWGMSWQKLMMWIFIISDGILFGAFLAAYGFNRLAWGSWPARMDGAEPVFHASFVTAMTFVLISSSAAMASAVHAARIGDRKWAVRWLALTLLGGMGFLGMQVFEWATIIGQGASLHGNPWGVPGFSAFFFMITGFHGTHVAIGAVILLVTLTGALRGRSTGESVELAGLYWHFVDLVWVFIFGCFYLI